MKNKNLLIRIVSLLCLSVLAQSVLAQEPTIERPPNVILVMADDLGTEAVGCYGGTSYPTPVLDKMAENGVRFSHAYSYPLCTPTRVSLMTGKYNFRNWKAFGILDPEEKTLGHYLQEEGYRTCMVGKWQLQSYDPAFYEGAELRRDKGMKVENAGFDEYCMWHTGHTEDKGSRYANPVIYQNGTFLNNTQGRYGPDIFTDYMLDFIKRHQEEPFFIYYPMALTHSPFTPTPDSDDWQQPTLRMQSDTSYFGDMVTYMDKIMGRLLAQLEEQGLSEETLVIFYSDNGTHTQIFSKVGDKLVQGGKTKDYDAGTRVPMIVQWKGHAKEGLLSDAMIAPSDFLPTIFEAIGRPFSGQTDGEGFLDALQGPTPNRRDWVMIDHNPRPGWDKDHLLPRTFVRGRQYKLYKDGAFFQPDKDPLEETPLQKLTKEQTKVQQHYQHILDSLQRYRTFGYIEKLDPALDAIVPPQTKIEVIAEGFTWTEGPVWIPQQQCLLFSDVPRNMVYKWTDEEGVEVFLKPAGYSGSKKLKGGIGTNGLALDNEGGLLLCRQGDREVARLASSYNQPLPVFESLATHWNGKRFNSPNDLCMDTKGSIYFTDPPFGINHFNPEGRETDFSGVYRVTKDGAVDLLVKDLPTPNGIALSPDEKTLYVANSNPAKWMAYAIQQDGSLSAGRVLLDVEELKKNSISKMSPDGMVVNSEGILFATGPDGVLIISPEGKHLGTIRTNKKTSNCDLNEDETVLYVTCDDYILRVLLGYELKGK